MYSTVFLMARFHGYVVDLTVALESLTYLESQTEVLNSPPLSLLPKNILRAPSHNPTDQNASPAYAALPNPSAAHPLRKPDQRFLDSEAFTSKFANHVSGPMEKVTRRTIKRWSGKRSSCSLGPPSLRSLWWRLCTRSRRSRRCIERS